MRRRATLAVAALPFGYGPASKAIALAKALRGDCRLAFVGHGSSLDLVSRTSGVFDEVVPARPDGPRALRLLSQSWGVLSVMDREAGAGAALAEKPLFVVDSLLWMRTGVPEALRHARVYWAQAFPGLSAGAYAPRPTVVGPVVAPRTGGPGRRREGLVVNLGGSAAPDGRRRLYASYARFVVRAVADAGLAARFGRVTVIGGAGAIGPLGDGDATRDGRLEVATVPHDDARERMARAEAVLTAPGMTATLECFCDRTPTWFLPPQNYSQWCILRRLSAAGVADDALHWEDLDGVTRLEEGMRPAESDPVVRETVQRLTGDRSAAASLRQRLERVGEAPAGLVTAQRAFFASLGSGGVEAIASALRRLLTAPGRVARAAARTPRSRRSLECT